MPQILIGCPICEQEMDIMECLPHVATYHPTFFITWMGTMHPQASTENMLETMRYFQMLAMEAIDDLNDENSYEYWSQLCDDIGYHRVGVEDIDSVAPKIDGPQGCEASEAPERSLDSQASETSETRCSICLEEISKHAARKIIKCGHTHCAECIETWFQDHKTCPICKCDVTEN